MSISLEKLRARAKGKGIHSVALSSATQLIEESGGAAAALPADIDLFFETYDWVMETKPEILNSDVYSARLLEGLMEHPTASINKAARQRLKANPIHVASGKQLPDAPGPSRLRRGLGAIMAIPANIKTVWQYVCSQEGFNEILNALD